MEKGGAARIDLKREAREDLSGHVHLLPCCIKHDGPTQVSHYFKPKPTGVVGEEDGLPLQQSHFRGRLLQGTTLPLPHGYSGFVLGKKTPRNKSDENSNSWETNATFQDITYWNHDYAPSQNDDFIRAFHWLTVANALHSPVTPEELESSSFTL
ncbi:uncharacterized protein [Cicer arietinum]|uniref:Ribonuclease H2 subunit C n=1 Tax=Cicer arietinum TaxID=3827 RepID=A0A1S2YP34_CICAR|nr:ribonuclease H2 subunit C [Cicer arietinum]